MNDLEELFEKEVKEFGQAFGYEAAYAFDVSACKLLELQERNFAKEKKELAERIIGDIPNSIDILPKAGFVQYANLKQQLREKYLK